jgi:diamine N-acetyltransferase
VGERGEGMADDRQVIAAEMASAPIINLTSERVALGPLHSGLLPLIERWENDLWVIDRGGDEPGPRSSDSVRAGWERLFKGEREDWLGFAIYTLPELRPIGFANIRDYSNRHGTAEFGISIFEASDRGQGYGTEAVQLLMDYAFSVLGVYNVWLDTPAYNHAALRAYEKVGFREIGRRRGARVLAGRRYDVVLMDCLADEFVPPRTRVLPEG